MQPYSESTIFSSDISTEISFFIFGKVLWARQYSWSRTYFYMLVLTYLLRSALVFTFIVVNLVLLFRCLVLACIISYFIGVKVLSLDEVTYMCIFLCSQVMLVIVIVVNPAEVSWTCTIVDPFLSLDASDLKFKQFFVVIWSSSKFL